MVDDIPDNLEFLSTVLTRQGYKVRSALSGQTALKVAKAAQPDLILLDIKMPEMDGYEVCQHLKSDLLTQEIPIIFLSALDQTTDKIRAFNLGGVDYIPKPFKAEELLARVDTHLKLRSAQAEIQKLNADLEQRVIQRTAQLEQEIGERLHMQEELLHMATHDSLTRLPNRIFLTQRLTQIINQNQPKNLALILLKCDQLQTINNSLGHHAVDQLLVSIARRLETCLESGIILAHYGEDTFAILIENHVDRENVIQFSEHLQQETTTPFHIDNCPIYIQIRVGISLCSQNYEQATHLLRDANTALHQAKAQGVGKIQVFNPDMYYRALSFFRIQNELHGALQNQELELVYQPIISLKDNTLKGAEALVRWHHPQRGIISPVEFIPVAEETGIIIALDRYVLRKACHQLRVWREQNRLRSSFRLQVNLSSLQLAQKDFIDYLDRVLIETQIDYQNLAFEITEYGLMQQNEVASSTLEELKRHQIIVSIDDFGTGYSSLSYLHSLKVENLKIDRSFISQIDGTPNSLKIVRSIINLAHELDMTVTAEGVETSEQLSNLTALGCGFAQGYFWGQPTDSDTMVSNL